MRKYLFTTILAAMLVPFAPLTVMADDDDGGHGHGHGYGHEHERGWERHEREEREWHHHRHVYRDNYYMEFGAPVYVEPRPVYVEPQPVVVAPPSSLNVIIPIH